MKQTDADPVVRLEDLEDAIGATAPRTTSVGRNWNSDGRPG